MNEPTPPAPATKDDLLSAINARLLLQNVSGISAVEIMQTVKPFIADFCRESETRAVAEANSKANVDCLAWSEKYDVAVKRADNELTALRGQVATLREACETAVAYYKEGWAACHKEKLHVALQFSRAADAVNNALAATASVPPAALPVNEDTARIEWLEKRHEFHADRGYEHGEPVTLQLVEGNINDRQYRTVGEGDTLRAAIDSARKATP